MTAPVTDQKALRRALGQFPTGVCVVTCQSGGEKLGMTMSSFNSLSLDPPLVLFSIDKRAKGLPLWEEARGYAIHVLSERQQALSNRFARPGNKWEGVQHDIGLLDAPLLPGAAVTFECCAFSIHDAGDHRLFIAEVLRHSADPDRLPLVFAQGRYATLEPGQDPAPVWPLAIHY